MYADLVPFFVVGLLGGGIWMVWFMASLEPVDARRLPVLIRVLRHPVAAGNPRRSVGVGVPFSTRSRDQFWIWWIFSGVLIVGSQTIQIRAATDARLAASLGSAPLVEALSEWALMAAWTLYVVLEFRRAARASRT